MTSTTLPNPKPRTPADVAKALAYVAAAGLGILTTTLVDNTFDVPDALALVAAVAGAFGVYYLTGTTAKTIAAAVVTAAQAALVLFQNGGTLETIDAGAWSGVALAALGAFLVGTVPNKDNAPAEVAVVAATPEAFGAGTTIENLTISNPLSPNVAEPDEDEVERISAVLRSRLDSDADRV